jgi:hypothetical protein
MRSPILKTRAHPRPAELSASRRTIAALAAPVAAMMADPAYAQTIDTLTQSGTQHFTSAFGYFLNMVCYIGGAIFLIASFIGVYQHQKNPNSVRPGYLIAGCIVGSFLLAFPYMAGTMTRTVTGTSITATGAQQAMTFTQ